MNIDANSLETIIENLHDGLYLVDRDRRITFWNKAAELITGYTAAEVMNRRCSDNILNHVDEEGNQLCLGMCPLAHCMEDGLPRDDEIYLHHKDGHRVPVSVRSSAIRDDNGNVTGAVELFTDISDQRSSELRLKELEKLAMLDNLTQLANRNFIEQELEKRFEEKRRFDVPFGIFFMDIDHFKRFNDTYGHDVGDRVLKTVADTFVRNSRPFDLYGRWGGEEFIGIIRNISSGDLERMGNKLRNLVQHSFIHSGEDKLQVTISIGATMVTEKDNTESLIKRADELLYKSKKGGRNRVTMG